MSICQTGLANEKDTMYSAFGLDMVSFRFLTAASTLSMSLIRISAMGLLAYCVSQAALPRQPFAPSVLQWSHCLSSFHRLLFFIVRGSPAIMIIVGDAVTDNIYYTEFCPCRTSPTGASAYLSLICYTEFLEPQPLHYLPFLR